MKQIIWMIVLLLGFSMGYAEVKPTSDSCVVVFSIQNNENKPYAWRTVVFSNLENDELVVGTTDSLGKASFLLPKNTAFNIAVLSGTSCVANYQLETPSHKGLVTFTYDVQIDLFEENREGETFHTEWFSNSQSLATTNTHLLVWVTLTSKNQLPLAQTTVLFRNAQTLDVYVGQTSDEGIFQILLPRNQSFGIRLVDKGIRVPFFDLSTVADTTVQNLSLDLEYTLSEEAHYYETIFRKKKEMQSVLIEEPERYILSNVLFEFDKAVLLPMACEVLLQVARKLNQRSFASIEIGGHTDSMGTDHYNQNLSERRARAVMNYFTELGLDPRKMHAVGFGEGSPIAGNDTDEGRARNRRTEIRVIQ